MYRFGNWIGSSGGTGCVALQSAHCRWGHDCFQQLLCAQITRQHLPCFVCTFLVFNYKNLTQLCLSFFLCFFSSLFFLFFFFFNVSFPFLAAFDTTLRCYIFISIFSPCIYPSILFLSTVQFCFLLIPPTPLAPIFFPLLLSLPLFSPLPPHFCLPLVNTTRFTHHQCKGCSLAIGMEEYTEHQWVLGNVVRRYLAARWTYCKIYIPPISAKEALLVGFLLGYGFCCIGKLVNGSLYRQMRPP